MVMITLIGAGLGILDYYQVFSHHDSKVNHQLSKTIGPGLSHAEASYMNNLANINSFFETLTDYVQLTGLLIGFVLLVYSYRYNFKEGIFKANAIPKNSAQGLIGIELIIMALAFRLLVNWFITIAKLNSAL
jgi:hypothetical protein